MEPLETAIIGCGGRARLALRDSRFRIRAGADPSEKGRHWLLQEVPDAAVFSDHREMLATIRPEVVFVTSPDWLHPEHASDALAAGAAVFCEKPLAITIEGATRILENARRHRGRFYVGHNLRHAPFLQTMRRLIDQGAIGRVQAAWCRHFISYGGDAYFKDWHCERRFGTGLLLQKGAHDLDILHWLCGARTRRVVAMGRLSVYDRGERRPPDAAESAEWRVNLWPPHQQKGLHPRIEVEDHSMVLMQLANGVQASYEQCHYTPDTVRNYTIIGDEGRLENVGDTGEWEVQLRNRRRHGFGPPDEVIRGQSSGEGHGGADEAILQEFHRFVREGQPASVSAVGAWDAVACGVRATESLRDENRPREVEPLSADLAAWLTRMEAGQNA